VAERTVIARIPAGQSLELSSSLTGFLGSALDSCLLSVGDSRGNAAEVVAGDGVTERDVIVALRRATRKLGKGPLPEPIAADEPDGGPGTLNVMRVADDGGVEFGIGSPVEHAREMARNLLAAFVPAFEATGAVNYLSWDLTHPDSGGRYSLIVVKPEGLTPHEARQQAEAEAERLRALLAEHGVAATEPVDGPRTPAELLHTTLATLRMSQAKLAATTGLSPRHINYIAQGKAPVSTATALLFEQATGVLAERWLHLEAARQLELARSTTPTPPTSAERNTTT
jgi:addiction module HigA family antidote